MKLSSTKTTLVTLSVTAIAFFMISWGFIGHERINNGAVMALPQPLQTFFYNHIDYLTNESTAPDLRKSVLQDKAEAPRHYFDMENFGPVDSLPKSMEEAKARYDEKFLSKNGTLPWYIQEMMVRLTKAFKEKRKSEILFIAGNLGHYIADAHMPLHTSDNHDGQNTGQKGVHSLWESKLPELFVKAYKLNAPEGKYLEDVNQATWAVIFDTHSLVVPLLATDKKLRDVTPENKMYVTDASGNIVKNKYGGMTYSNEYATQFHTALNGMVEAQMKKAITATASFWYTAWVNAGKPDLSDLDAPSVTARNKSNLKKDRKLFQKGNLSGFTTEKED